MSTLDKAVATQLANIQSKAGKTLDELGGMLRASGHDKHGALRTYAQEQFGLGYGDANTLVHILMRSDGASQAREPWTGPPAHPRACDGGPEWVGDFEIAPKKGYVSLRRKKQFAMLGPGTNTRVNVGLNMKGRPERTGSWNSPLAECAATKCASRPPTRLTYNF